MWIWLPCILIWIQFRETLGNFTGRLYSLALGVRRSHSLPRTWALPGLFSGAFTAVRADRLQGRWRTWYTSVRIGWVRPKPCYPQGRTLPDLAVSNFLQERSGPWRRRRRRGDHRGVAGGPLSAIAGCATIHSDRWNRLIIARPPDRCQPPVGRLERHRYPWHIPLSYHCKWVRSLVIRWVRCGLGGPLVATPKLRCQPWLQARAKHDLQKAAGLARWILVGWISWDKHQFY